MSETSYREKIDCSLNHIGVGSEPGSDGVSKSKHQGRIWYSNKASKKNRRNNAYLDLFRTIGTQMVTYTHSKGAGKGAFGTASSDSELVQRNREESILRGQHKQQCIERKYNMLTGQTGFPECTYALDYCLSDGALNVKENKQYDIHRLLVRTLRMPNQWIHLAYQEHLNQSVLIPLNIS